MYKVSVVYAVFFGQGWSSFTRHSQVINNHFTRKSFSVRDCVFFPTPYTEELTTDFLFIPSFHEYTK